jgi:ATP/maltotriose-dependent transcriptional regulator MalT
VEYREADAAHEAIEHAIAAGDFADAIGLITTHWYEFLQRGRQETVAGWIDKLPSDTVIHDPKLCGRGRPLDRSRRTRGG